MRQGWLDRLRQVIADDGRSYNKISEDAGLGRNYVQQMIRDGKAPSVDRLEKILATFTSARSVYVILGIELTAEDIRLLEALRSVPPESRAEVEGFLTRLAETLPREE